jgi:hypothetical protein
MNLAQLQSKGLADLYPPLQTRSGAKIQTNDVRSEIVPDGLAVFIKTVFPPSDRRVTQLVVTEMEGGFHVRPLQAEGTPDAQRFAERLRDRFLQEAPDEPMAPLVLVRDGEQRYGFRVAPAAREGDHATPQGRERASLTEPATPAGRRAPAGPKHSEKGDS